MRFLWSHYEYATEQFGEFALSNIHACNTYFRILLYATKNEKSHIGLY